MTQAEVESNNPETPQSSGEGDNAQEGVTLEQLLNEYDTPKQETKPEQATPTQAAPDPITAEMQRFIERQVKKDNRQALNDAAKNMKQIAGIDLDDDFFLGQLHVAADKDPRIGDIFNKRDENPKAWNDVVKAIGKDIAKRSKAHGDTDQESTDSWNAVEASVRSSSTSRGEEPPIDWGSLTDREFAEKKAELNRRSS